MSCKNWWMNMYQWLKTQNIFGVSFAIEISFLPHFFLLCLIQFKKFNTYLDVFHILPHFLYLAQQIEIWIMSEKADKFSVLFLKKCGKLWERLRDSRLKVGWWCGTLWGRVALYLPKRGVEGGMYVCTYVSHTLIRYKEIV